MVDKYHSEWIIRGISMEYRIAKARLRAFGFLTDMSDDLNNAIEMLEGSRHIPIMLLHLMKQK